MIALILVDIQNDFLPGGALAVPDGEQIIEPINQLQHGYDLVVATQDWHPQDHGSFAANHPGAAVGQTVTLAGLDQVLWPVHCVQDSQGAAFHPSLDVSRIARVFHKGTDPTVDSYSGFFDNARRNKTGLDRFLAAQGAREVHIVGLATDYCARFTALDAHSLGYRTSLIKDCCRAVNLQSGDETRAIAELSAAGVAVVTSAELRKA